MIYEPSERPRIEKAIRRVLEHTDAFTPSGIEPARVAAALATYVLRSGIAGKRTVMEIAIYSAEELIANQARGERARSGGAIADYFASTFRRAMADASTRPKVSGRFPLSVMDHEFEDSQMAAVMAEAAKEAAKPRGVRVKPEQVRAALGGLERPAWAKEAPAAEPNARDLPAYDEGTDPRPGDPSEIGVAVDEVMAITRGVG